MSTAYDDTMRVWRADEDDWSCTATLVGHTGTVWCAAFNGDGSRLVSCSDDRSLRLWRYDDADATFSLLHTIENVSKRPLFAVSWSAVNGLVAVAAGDNAIYLFGAADADCTALQLLGSEQRAHDSDVNSVSWSSDGSLLASAGDDAAINVWRVAGNR